MLLCSTNLAVRISADFCHTLSAKSYRGVDFQPNFYLEKGAIKCDMFFGTEELGEDFTQFLKLSKAVNCRLSRPIFLLLDFQTSRGRKIKECFLLQLLLSRAAALQHKPIKRSIQL